MPKKYPAHPQAEQQKLQTEAKCKRPQNQTAAAETTLYAEAIPFLY